MKSINFRLFLSILVLLAGLYYSLPNIPAIGNSFISDMLPSQRINLGLDLKGGMNLTLGVDVEKAIESTLSITGQGVRDRIISEGHTVLRPRLTDGELEIIVPKKGDATAIKEIIQKWYPNLQLVSENVYNAGSAEGLSLKYVLTDMARKEAESLTLDQVVRTIRNRIDQFGVAEPDIRKQSNNQVQVQLPGLTDTSRAIQIVGQTAHLEFRLVRDDINPNSMVLPAGTSRFPLLDKKGGKSTVILDNEVLLTGADIANARPSFDQYGSSYVSLKFSPQGAIAFEKITGENIKKRLAIVLDGEVYSAPRHSRQDRRRRSKHQRRLHNRRSERLGSCSKSRFFARSCQYFGRAHSRSFPRTRIHQQRYNRFRNRRLARSRHDAFVLWLFRHCCRYSLMRNTDPFVCRTFHVRRNPHPSGNRRGRADYRHGC